MCKDQSGAWFVQGMYESSTIIRKIMKDNKILLTK